MKFCEKRGKANMFRIAMVIFSSEEEHAVYHPVGTVHAE